MAEKLDMYKQELRWKACSRWLLLLFTSFFVFSCYGSEILDSDVSPVRFRYAFLDASVVSPSQIADSNSWPELIPEKTNLKPVDGKVLWMKFNVPMTAEIREPVLKFERLQVSFRFFHGNKLKQSFGEGLPYPGLPVHLLALPDSDGSAVVWLRVESKFPWIGPKGRVLLGSRSHFVTQLIKGDVEDFFVVSILALVGVAGLAAFAFYSSVRTYLNLGCFAVSCGLYFLGRMPSKIIFGIDPVLSGFIGLCGLYSTPFFFLEFYREIFSVGQIGFLRRLQFISGAFSIFAIGFSFVTPSGPLNLLFPFYILAVPTFLSAIIFAVWRLRDHQYAKTFFTGVMLMFLSGLWEAARELRYLNVSQPMIVWGFLGLIISLIVMQGQYFSNLFQRVRHNARLAEDARGRLERVLACTHELSRIRNFNALIQVVADAIIAELNLHSEDVSVDFFIINSEMMDEDGMRQFRYIFSSELKTSNLFELRGKEKLNLEDVFESLDNNRSPTRAEHDAMSDDLPKSIQTAPKSVLTIPLLSTGLIGAVTIRRYSNQEFGQTDLSHLNKFVNSISASLLIALQNLEYVSEVKARALMENELDAAVSLQAALLPEPLDIPGIKYAAYCKSAGKTGGDWHGYYFCTSQNRLFLTVGDVTGHDFASSIMTGVAAGVVKAWEQHDSQNFADSGAALEDLASLVNRVFCGSNRGLKFMSMFFACLELNSGRLYVVNAGHPHPFLIAKGHPVTSILSSGHILGHESDAKFSSECTQLEPRNTILIYTDGLFENHGENGECLHRRGVIRAIENNETAQAILESVLSRAQKTWSDVPADDDVTLVAVTWIPESAELPVVA